MSVVVEFFFQPSNSSSLLLALVLGLCSVQAWLSLTRHAGQTGGAKRALWLMAGALVAGLGVWALYLIALLAGWDLAALTGAGFLSASLVPASALIGAAGLGGMLLDSRARRRLAGLDARNQAAAQKLAEELAEARRNFDLAVNHIPHGMALFDAKGRMQLHNWRLFELLAMPADDTLIGRSFEYFCRAVVGRSGLSREVATEEMIAAIVAEHYKLAQTGGEVIYTINEENVLRVQHSSTGDGGWVTMLEDISRIKHSEAMIAHLSQHDPLTSLPNRSHFDEHFEAALGAAEAQGSMLAVVAIDLDNFKDVNDRFGHGVGDRILCNLADRLTAILMPDEMVARLGGDEFAALKPFTTTEALREFLRRLEHAIVSTIRFENVAVAISGSMGVAVFPSDGADRSKLLNNANLALQRAKAEIDRNICYYEYAMDEYARQRRVMARDIWQAVESEGFELVYQVQHEVATGQVSGYEALIRWNRPGYGPASPAEFVPVAEECGAIGALGNWVLQAACAQAATWPAPYKIAVNISGMQLVQVDLADTVRTVLLQSGLAPERLELEVTETAIIADKRRAKHNLRLIKALGVSIALDDFGTGYSSFDTLRSFPFDKIKLDRSFISDIERNEQSKAFFRAILALGRSLGVPILAEGVETPAQLEVLRFEGCTEVQGYFLGRPGPLDWDEGRMRA